MIKNLQSRILLIIGFMAVVLMLTSVHLNAGSIDNPNGFPISAVSNVAQTDIKDLYQSESPGLMAHEHEHYEHEERYEHEEHHEHHCVSHCRHHYEERLNECNEPGHEHHHRCEEWAREREKECLDKCYEEYPR